MSKTCRRTRPLQVVSKQATVEGPVKDGKGAQTAVSSTTKKELFHTTAPKPSYLGTSERKRKSRARPYLIPWQTHTHTRWATHAQAVTVPAASSKRKQAADKNSYNYNDWQQRTRDPFFRRRKSHECGAHQCLDRTVTSAMDGRQQWVAPREC